MPHRDIIIAFGLQWTRVWVEDECTRRDLDAEKIEEAWLRIFKEPFDRAAMSSLDDQGDTFFYTREQRDRLFCQSFDGNSIYVLAKQGKAAHDGPSTRPAQRSGGATLDVRHRQDPRVPPVSRGGVDRSGGLRSRQVPTDHQAGSTPLTGRSPPSVPASPRRVSQRVPDADPTNPRIQGAGIPTGRISSQGQGRLNPTFDEGGLRVVSARRVTVQHGTEYGLEFMSRTEEPCITGGKVPGVSFQSRAAIARLYEALGTYLAEWELGEAQTVIATKPLARFTKDPENSEGTRVTRVGVATPKGDRR